MLDIFSYFESHSESNAVNDLSIKVNITRAVLPLCYMDRFLKLTSYDVWNNVLQLFGTNPLLTRWKQNNNLFQE